METDIWTRHLHLDLALQPQTRHLLRNLQQSYRRSSRTTKVGHDDFTKAAVTKCVRSLADLTIAADDAKDETSIEGTMKYMEELEVMEDAAMLIGLEIVQSPSMGIMKKQAFVDGWIKAT